MRLKPIPQNTVVHTPAEEEAKELLAILHENGYKWCDGHPISKKTFWGKYKYDICYCLEFPTISYAEIKWFKTQNYYILTLAEFKERYCEKEKPQPKFTVGEKVLYNGKIKVVNGIDQTYIGFMYNLSLPNGQSPLYLHESMIAPYTKPETKPTEGMETKELNLCELLKGHEGETFYSPFYGDVTLEEIHTPTVEMPKYYLLVRPKSYSVGREAILPNGINHDGGQVALFPSRALYEKYPLDPYTAWMKWQEEQMPKLLSVTLGAMGDGNTVYKMLQFRTAADRDKCIEEINALIEKYQK